MNLKPMHDWAVIRPSEAMAVSAGGLYIPDTAKDKPQEGTVEAIGPGAYEEEKRTKKTDEKKERRFIPTTVKPGDRVLYEKYAGQTYKIANEELVLVRERDILGILLEKAVAPKPLPPLQIPATTAQKTSSDIMVRAADKGALTGKTGAPKKAAKKPAPKKAAPAKAKLKKNAAKNKAAAKPSRKTAKKKKTKTKKK
ncbi:MAG TPA: co-chaperone GroES [Nitrospirota bacterium]|nr:co-chaperone GroES [Nitrospirota bacterium]